MSLEFWAEILPNTQICEPPAYQYYIKSQD